MMGHKRLQIFLFFTFTCCLACKRSTNSTDGPPFVEQPESALVKAEALIEASGIADSKANPGHLWVLEDSGTPPIIHLLKRDGTLVHTLAISNAFNWDWEDMALGKGPDPAKDYLYIADIGDNNRNRMEYSILRFEEPKATVDTIYKVDRIAFIYPDGAHNSEALFVDPATLDIYLITKTDHHAGIYKLTFPYSATRLNYLEKVGELTYNFVTGAAVSPSGDEILLRTYGDIFYYKHKAGETIEQSLTQAPITLPHWEEPQGEAVAFAAGNSGYYTLSEKGLATRVNLYFYKRK